jgi:hypothetical protein
MRIRMSLTKEIPNAVVLETLEVLIGQGVKDMAAKEEVVSSCWSHDPVHANLHAYYKLASNTIQLIEGRMKIDSTGGKRQHVDTGNDPSARSGSGPESGSGNKPKKQRTISRNDPGHGNIYGNQSHYSGGASRVSGSSSNSSRHDGRYNSGGYNRSGQNRQRREYREYGPKAQYYATRGEYRGRRFLGSVRTETPTSPANIFFYQSRLTVAIVYI